MLLQSSEAGPPTRDLQLIERNQYNRLASMSLIISRKIRLKFTRSHGP